MAKASIEITAQDKTKAAFDSARKNLAGLGEQAAALPARFGTLGLAITAAFSAVTVKSAIDVLDKLDDLSEKTGISVESLSSLRYAGEVTGTSIDSLATGVTKLAKNMADAATGGKETSAAFSAVGVAVKNADGSLRGQDAVLGDLADRFKSYQDGAAKSALAQKIFGKSGAEMIPLLNLGSDGIARLRQEAEGLGAVYGGELAKAGAQFNDNLKKLELNAEAAKVSLAGSLLPALNSIIEAFIRMKSAGQVWTVIKDSAKDMVGMGRLTDDPGADINKLMQDRTRKQADLAFSKKKGFATRDLQDDLFQIEQLLEASRVRQAGRALSNAGDVGDAVSRRMGSGRPKKDAPAVGGGAGGGANADNSAQRELEKQAKLLLELNGLTGSFAEDWQRLNDIFKKGSISLAQLTEAQSVLLSKQPAIKAQIDAEQKLLDIREKNDTVVRAHADTLAANNAELVKSNRTLLDEVEEIGLNAEALNMLRMARIDSNIAREEEALLQAQSIEGNELEAAQMERALVLLKEQRDIKKDGIYKQQRADETEEAKRRTDTISESISQGVMTGFRNGGSFADVFLNELKAQFAKTVLMPIIRPQVEAGNDLISGLFKGAGGGGGFGSIFSGLFGGGFSPMGGAGGSMGGGGDFGLSSLAGSLSFDGGGYTGDGLRTGGLDGKGGFMAMMHPQETVLDHTKGQGGSNITLSNNITVGGGMASGEVYKTVQQALAENNRQWTEQLKRQGVLA